MQIVCSGCDDKFEAERLDQKYCKQKCRPQIEFNGKLYTRFGKSKYYERVEKDKKYYLHREIWKFHNGDVPPKYHIHHVDENTENNDITNLECLSPAMHGKITRYEQPKSSIKCIECGDTFKVINKTLAEYCSGKCFQARRRRFKNHLEDKVCEVCGQLYKRPKYTKGKSCSPKCRGILTWKKRSQQVDHGHKIYMRICQNCQKAYEARHPSSKYCCKKCKSKYEWKREIGAI